MDPVKNRIIMRVRDVKSDKKLLFRVKLGSRYIKSVFLSNIE